jgi:hypothetical protein
MFNIKTILFLKFNIFQYICFSYKIYWFYYVKVFKSPNNNYKFLNA